MTTPNNLPAEEAVALPAEPRLPSLIRYYDDFHDKVRTISNLDSSDVWLVHADGQESRLQFSSVPNACRTLLKHIVVDLFDRCDPSTVVVYASKLFDRGDHLAVASVSTPADFAAYWNERIRPAETNMTATALRSSVHSMCNLSVGHWRPEFRDFVRTLRSPRVDIYKTVRTRECFVPLDQQSIIIEYFDEMKESLEQDAQSISFIDLRNACILLMSHQHGLRPGSIARIKIQDVRIHESGSVHVSIPLIKLRGNDSLRRVTRRIKHDWAGLYVALLSQRQPGPASTGHSNDHLFQLTPASVASVIRNLTAELLGEAWSPTDLRHTAAQRLADVGASHISLSEFLGHTTTLTANVYFDGSLTQAERINEALSLSPIYTEIAQVARTKTISRDELKKLPPTNQIGAVPHGIPISGIGSCSIGQSLCAKNPVLSCYTCRRFLPVSDHRVHEDVVESLRPVVKMFAASSHSSDGTGSHAQLSRTLRAVGRVIQDLSINSETGSSALE